MGMSAPRKLARTSASAAHRGVDVPFAITDVSGCHATPDFAHPLAGEALVFSVTHRVMRTVGRGRTILMGDA